MSSNTKDKAFMWLFLLSVIFGAVLTVGGLVITVVRVVAKGPSFSSLLYYNGPLVFFSGLILIASSFFLERVVADAKDEEVGTEATEETEEIIPSTVRSRNSLLAG